MKIDFTKSFFTEPPAVKAWPPTPTATPRRSVSWAGAGAPRATPPEHAHGTRWSGRLRALLLLGCTASVVAASTLGDPSLSLRADPQLAVLLRGMAVLKALMVLAGLGVLGWRFGHPIARVTAALYLGGAWLVAGATALIWQLTALPLAALVFHVAGFGLLWVAFADRKSGNGVIASRPAGLEPATPPAS